MKLCGKLYEIGDLDGTGARGIRIESNGETIELTGMTQDELRTIAHLWGERITITVSAEKVTP